METKTNAKKRTGSGLKTLDITYIGMFVALTAVFSWISVPYTVPFTLQTLAVFLTAALLGTKRSVLAVIAYILLGAAGAPVFQGFSGGIGVLFGTTGGYIIGFIFTALTTGSIISRFGKKTHVLAVAMAAGLIVCYAFGTVWFMCIYTATQAPIGILATLGFCVFPFIIPDACKIVVAVVICKCVGRFIGNLLDD